MSAIPHLETSGPLREGELLVGGRLRVEGKIGEGGMGVVYAAHDRELGCRVALKTLRRMHPEAVYHLKREFRTLASLHHPSLVAFHDLYEEDGRWFFTMQWVEGIMFDAWARPGGSLDEGRLRSSLLGLLDAIEAIHGAGLLHCDLKPHNVLVGPTGQVRMLDFGLSVAREAAQAETPWLTSGTPGYVAPEQVSGKPATEASDLYALGVMLFEALTGELPFEGEPYQMLFCKQWLNPPSPSSLQEDLPEDLSGACRALLARDPERRPSVGALREALSAPKGGGRRRLHSSVVERPVGLVGREPELRALHTAFEDSCARGSAPVLVRVSGESGIGKSALLRHFEQRLTDAGRAQVLSGRSFERERVPFKAFDMLVDQLSATLAELPAQSIEPLLPADTEALRTLFPVLARVEAIARATRLSSVVDPHERRQRAFRAFGELLAKLSQRAPLVLWLDDVQWACLDSLRLLEHVLSHARMGRLLVVISHRDAQRGDHPVLDSLGAIVGRLQSLDSRTLHVGPLEAEAAARLLSSQLEPSRSPSPLEAHGNPFWLLELARHARRMPASGRIPSLPSLILGRVVELDTRERDLLQTLAIAAGPLSLGLAAEAAGAGAEQAGRRLLGVLEAGCLARSTGSADEVECFHDRVRETVLEAMSPDMLRDGHRALACALERRPEADSEQIATHLLGAGEVSRAVDHLLRAAARAAEGFGFERASSLYERALSHAEAIGLQFSDEVHANLWRALARAHQNAGRPFKSAQAWLRAAAISQVPRDTIHATELLFATGAIDEGKAAVAPLLERARVSLPSGTVGALVTGQLWRVAARLRGLAVEQTRRPPGVRGVARGFVRQLVGTRAAGAADPLRAELCFGLSVALGRTDPVGAYALQGRALHEAIRSGDARDLVRGLGPELMYLGVTGNDENRRLRVRDDLLRAMDAADDPESEAFGTLCVGYEAFLRGELRTAQPLLGQAHAAFVDMRALGWLCDVASQGLVWLHWLRGDYAELTDLLPPRIESALQRQNWALATQYGVIAATLCCVRDDMVAATRTLAETRERAGLRLSPADTFSLERASWEIALYAGDHARAEGLARAYRRTWRPLWRFGHVRTAHTWFEAVGALARVDGRASLRSVRRAGERLCEERIEWSKALGLSLLAATYARRGRTRLATDTYARAASLLVRHGFDAQGEAAELHAAHLRGDARSAGQLRTRLEARGIHDLPRWLMNTLPGPAQAP